MRYSIYLNRIFFFFGGSLIHLFDTRLCTLASEGLRVRTAPGVHRPLLLPQFQSPLLDSVNGNVLNHQTHIIAPRVLDPSYLHIVYLVPLLLSRATMLPLTISAGGVDGLGEILDGETDLNHRAE